MSLIDQLNAQISLLESQKKFYTTKRIHFFYEGAVTEKELIDLVEQKFSENTELFKYLEFKVHKNATTKFKNILNTLTNGQYISTNNRTERIFDDDYIVYLYDLDVLFDFKNGRNTRNTERVIANRKHIKRFIFKLRTKFKKSNFHLIFSFPSIEYAIALGLSSNYNLITCLNSAYKKPIFNYFSNVKGQKVSVKTKHFAPLFYETNLFVLDSVIANAKIDRQKKFLPLDSLRPHVERKEVHSLLDINKPFTYFDNIISIAERIISDLLNSK